MQMLDRIGIDLGMKTSVEDVLRWAATHGLHYVDFRLDASPEAFVAFTPEHSAALRTQAEAAGITIGLHTRSAVKIAEMVAMQLESGEFDTAEKVERFLRQVVQRDRQRARTDQRKKGVGT